MKKIFLIVISMLIISLSMCSNNLTKSEIDSNEQKEAGKSITSKITLDFHTWQKVERENRLAKDGDKGSKKMTESIKKSSPVVISPPDLNSNGVESIKKSSPVIISPPDHSSNAIGSNNTDERIIKIVKVAKKLVGKRYKKFHYNRKTYRGDCSGFIEFLFATQKVKIVDPAIKLRGNGEAYRIYYSMKFQASTHTNKIPRQGDLVFFHNSYDKNKDGKENDPLTHIGIVENVDTDGTIHFI
ncbi:MAG: CHAP domain-containing protein, partial [Spirochaetota bacterium]|nr:CHAP domain-containing protein [Spirochaetota bacterium]